ncbi:MAG: hypothetical protein ACFCUI_07010 [Bernardetiaceae bacterium]
MGFFLTTIGCAYGQGCSDAGFCTMGAMKPDQPYSKSRVQLRSIEISQYSAMVTDAKSVLAYTADLTLGVGERTMLQVKIPYQIAFGPMGDFGGMSDISLSYTRALIQREDIQINATLGTKIPTNQANKQVDGRTLPMFYQSSLGSIDAIAGAAILTRHWLLAVGYQQALTRNGSAFAWGPWRDDDKFGKAQTYPASIELLRGIDVMLRIERNIRFSNVNFSLGLLPIYRLTQDQITSPQTGERVRIKDSDGLALSALVSAGYRFSVKSGVRLILGQRLVDRYINTDGLYRKRILTVGYDYRF